MKFHLGVTKTPWCPTKITPSSKMSKKNYHFLHLVSFFLTIFLHIFWGHSAREQFSTCSPTSQAVEQKWSPHGSPMLEEVRTPPNGSLPNLRWLCWTTLSSSFAKTISGGGGSTSTRVNGSSLPRRGSNPTGLPNHDFGLTKAFGKKNAFWYLIVMRKGGQ